jgi:hypothetical protein
MLTRILMWIHFIWLLALPSLALVGIGLGAESDGALGFAVMVGFAPVAVFLTSTEHYYQLPDSLPRAVVVVGLVPAQIALNVWLFGGGFWLFLVEEAAVEVTALSAALAYAMIRHRPTGAFGAVVGVLLTVAAAATFVVPVLAAHDGDDWWWTALFATAFVSAFWELAQIFAPAAKEFVETGATQDPPVEHDGGWFGDLADLVVGFGSRGRVLRPRVREMYAFVPSFAAWFLVGIGIAIAAAIMGG